MDKAHTQSRRTIAVLSPDYLDLALHRPGMGGALRPGCDQRARPADPGAGTPVRARGPARPDRLRRPCRLRRGRGRDRAARAGAVASASSPTSRRSSRAKPGHAAVLERPHFPGAVRAAVASGSRQALIGGGIAAAVIGALLTWWLSGRPISPHGDQRRRRHIGICAPRPPARRKIAVTVGRSLAGCLADLAASLLQWFRVTARACGLRRHQRGHHRRPDPDRGRS